MYSGQSIIDSAERQIRETGRQQGDTQPKRHNGYRRKSDRAEKGGKDRKWGLAGDEGFRRGIKTRD